MFKRIVFGLLICFSSVAFADDNDLKYQDAYERALKEEKPLVVFIGAKWCSSCETMKQDTITPMKKDDLLKDVVFVAIDADDEADLVQKLYVINDETKKQSKILPQIMIFSHNNDKPKKFGLIGMQSKRRVLELFRKVLK